MADEANVSTEQNTNVQNEGQQTEGTTDVNGAQNTNAQEPIAESNPETGNSSDNGDNNTDSGTIAEDEPYMTARYNKADVSLTREEATSWAQKGMLYNDKLDYLATVKGFSSINDFLKDAIDKVDSELSEEIREQFGDDEEMLEKMVRLRKEDNREKYEKAVADRALAEQQKEKDRIAEIGDEFIELQKRFPELKTVSDLPSEVLKEANEKSLEHAYLNFLFNEAKSKETAVKSQKAAEEKTTGSLNSEKNNDGDSLLDALSKGIFG